MRKRSTPRSTKTGQMTSRKAAARTIVPSDALGATFFAANATAKWPMNILSSLSEQRFLEAARYRIVAEPDAQQCAIEILAGDRRALRLAVEEYARSRSGQPVERNHVALFPRAKRVHYRDEFGHARFQGFLLGGRRVVADSFVERVGELLRTQVAHQAHGDALRARQGEHLRGARSLLREIEPRDVDLEEGLGAQPGTVQYQLARFQLDALVDLDARDFGRERRSGEKREEQQFRPHQALSYSR